MPTAIDPENCGCTECITGEYIPLEYATPAMIRDMLAGYIQNNTSLTFHIDIIVTASWSDDQYDERLSTVYLKTSLS